MTGLSARWTPLRYHKVQARLWKENRRFCVVPAGRRSGKTELAKRRLVVELAKVTDFADPRYFVAAPTRDQAKRIFWNDMKALIPKEWIRRTYENELCITTIFSSELWVVGLDKPQRIEGVAWNGGVLDEYANMRPGAWTENIRPALSDRSGWCWFIGVPEGLNHYKELADYAGSGVDKDWGLYRWHSSDILPQDEVEAAKRVMDSRTFRQEYEASFEGASGRVYYAYLAEVHQNNNVLLKADMPIVICCDFNVDPCVWLLLQTDGRTVWVFDEVVLRNTNTVEMARTFLERYPHHSAGVLVYGDAAGNARSTTGKSDYALLFEMGLKDQRIKRANPNVRDRVNALNSMLENSKREARLFHHPRCEYLRKDLECVVWKEGCKDIDKTDPDRTHATDALGYFIDSEFPIRMHRPKPEYRFYK